MNEEKSESRRAVKLPPYPGLEKVHRANLRLFEGDRPDLPEIQDFLYAGFRDTFGRGAS